MLRFLRQYNTWILAVGGTLLLVSWGLGGALSNFTGKQAVSGSTWATYGSGNSKITEAQLESLRTEMRVVDVLRDQSLQALGADKDPAHWFLLVREAQDAGLVGGEGDGRDVLQAMATMISTQNAAQGQPAIDADTLLSRLVIASRTDSRVVLQTLAKVNGINRLRRIYQSMPRFSDTRLQSAAASSLDAIAADVLVLDARKLSAPPVPPPTEEELQAQLAKFGDKLPGQGEFGFGYRLPDRLKLEWIELPEASIRASVETSGALDSLTLKKRFAEDPSKYGAQVTGDPLAVYPQYADTVRQKALDEITAERIAEISKFTSDQLAISLRGLPKELSFFVLPTDWAARRPSLQQLAEQIATQFKIPLPAYASSGDAWLTLQDVKSMRGVGASFTNRFGPKAVSLPDLLDKLKEFGRGMDTMPLQKDVASPAMTSATKDLFFFRVMDVDPSRAPNSVDEVRGALVLDVEALKRFEVLTAMQSQLDAKARADGLRAIASEYGGTVDFVGRLRESAPETIAYGIRIANIPGLGNNLDAVREVIRMASALPVDRPITEIAEADRTFMVPLPKQLSLLLVRVTDLFPLTIEDFQTVAANPRIQDALLGDEFRNATFESLKFETLKKRHNFHLVREKDEKDAKDPTDPAAAKSGSAQS